MNMNRQSAKTVSVVETRSRRAQDYSIMWVDNNIDLSTEDFRNSLSQLRSAVNEVTFYIDPAECIDALNKLNEGKVFMISSGTLGQHLVPEVHGIERLNTIFIFCDNKTQYEQWAKNWPKIEGVYTSIEAIYESLKKVVHVCNHNDIPMSIIPKALITTSNGSDKHNLDQLSPMYMYSVIFKEIILEVDDDDEKQINAVVTYCREKNVPESELINFRWRYHQRSPIWWYTCEMFLYTMLNQALRTLDVKRMTKMGFFIRHLHLQLEHLHKEQSADFHQRFTVYRGQGLTPEAFQDLYASIGGLLSFNNFLSATEHREISMEFISHAMIKDKECIGVLFIMTIDPEKISPSVTPFACIDDVNAMGEKKKEILFTIHTVFRVIKIKPTDENIRLYEVQLTLTGDNDSQMTMLTQQLKDEFGGSGWYRMGGLMLRLGYFDQAEELYNLLLENATNDANRAFIYDQLGCVKEKAGEYQGAIEFYEKSLKIDLKKVSEDDISLAPTYNNIAVACRLIGDYSKALKFYEKTLKIDKKTLHQNHQDLATSYNNIAQVYNHMGNYTEALEFYEKSYNILEKILLPNHPDLAAYYNCIGEVYNNVGKYSTALEFYKKSYQILEETLPANHPDLASSCNNIGLMYNNMGNYSKALNFYEKSYQIWGRALPLNHPDLAVFYNNMGAMYCGKGDYSKALEFYEESLKIRKTIMPSNHPDLAQFYNNIGIVYKNVGDYSKALEFYEKANKINLQLLPPNHPHIAADYHNIGQVHSKKIGFLQN